MSTYEVLGQIFDAGGCLVAVRESRFDADAAFVTGIQLEFENMIVAAVAEGEFDTITLRRGPLGQDPEATTHVVNADSSWSAALGKDLRWGWLMKNHQGYEDGIQFEFAETTEGPGITIQLMVEASAITYSDVSRRGREC